MKICDINPHIRYARNIPLFFPNNQFTRCYDCRLFFFKTASGTAIINGEKYNLSNNCAIFIPPASRYKFILDGGKAESVSVFNFDLCQSYNYIEKTLSTVTDDLFDAKRVPAYEPPEEFSFTIVRQQQGNSELLYEAAEEFLEGRRFFREIASALLKSYLTELLRNEFSGGKSGLTESVIKYISESYSEPSLTNESIAKHFGYHPYHISKLMREDTGKSLKQYVIYYRIQIAKRLLVTTDLDIEGISWRCGFCSSAYFVKTFREATSLTPKKYRDAKRVALL